MTNSNDISQHAQMPKNVRCLYIDVMKAWGIVMVVIGHVEIMCLHHAQDSLAFIMLTSYHMPLFFFISGYLTFRKAQRNDNKSIWTRLRRKGIVFIGSPVVFLCLKNVLCLSRGENLSFAPDLGSACFGGYWFTISLFCDLFIFYWAKYITNRLRIKIGLFASICLMGIALVGSIIYSEPHRSTVFYKLLNGSRPILTS